MHWTVDKLRAALVALALLLAAGIFIALSYARWQARHIARDLPARLGAQVQQSTEGFTYSKTEQGRTVFTLHAAKTLQYRKGGRALLHDVRIQIFNQQDGSADTVRGDKFEYDPQIETVRALGEAEIDLHLPATATPPAQHTTQNAQIAQKIHVVTDGLLFNQKTGVATSDGEIIFHAQQGDGTAIGAVYDSRQGVLLLKSDVVLHTQTQKGPAVIHASQAVYEQRASKIEMEDARYATATEDASARIADMVLRQDSSVETMHAETNVQYQTRTGTQLASDSMDAAFDENNHPKTAHFMGNVHMRTQQAQDTTDATAEDGLFLFGAQGVLRQGALDRNVHVRQNVLASPAPIDRNLKAGRLVMDFVPGAAGHAFLKQATATGDAVFEQRPGAAQTAPAESEKKHVALPAGPSGPAQPIVVSAELLVAHFAAGNQLLRLDGQQKTLLRSVDANGDVDTSTGDTLHVFFHPAPPTAKGARQGALAAGAIAPNNVQSAVQTGHVVLQQVAANGGTERTAPQGKTQPQISTATAEKAEYLADTERLTLTGAPYFKDQQMEMSAQQIWVNRVTGEVMATRNVQATVREGSGASGGLNFGNAPDDGPAHVIADRARLDRTAQQATFTGQARLWQGQNTVEAPVLEMDEAQQSLLAHGARNGDLVHCTFASQQAPDSKKGPGNTAVSVVSEHLLYSDAERKAHFTGHVVATLQGGQLISNVADVYLQPVVQGGRPEANQQSAPGVPAQSSVERIEASGDVQMVQPGRHGTGAEIVYTASDGHFVLTGSGHSPPRIVDAEHGSLTGERLIYESEQDTVLVEGGNSLTTTKTWVKK